MARREAELRGRTLHLLDVENLMGGPRAGVIALRAALVAYVRAVGVGRSDLVVLACNPRLAYEAGAAWPGALVKARHGRDGADLALLAECEPCFAARRFGRVVLGSGDGIFSVRAAVLRGAGLRVEVAARKGHLSWALRRAAHAVHDLPDPPGDLTFAA